MLFIGLFFINPISIVLSFASVPGVKTDDFLNKVLSFSGALTNIDRAQLRINMLGLRNVSKTRAEFISLVKEHYKNQVLMKVYAILGSFEFLGSPLSLVNNLGTGFYDFFYEPAQGLVKADPQEFAKGMAKGTGSLVGNLAQGVFNSAGKFTGSIGQGVATLSFDTDYLREREKASRDKPRHAGEGVAYGIRDFGKGLWHGATGVVMQPIKGAKEEGVLGFGKGIGRGVVGIAAKPLAGTFDLISQTADGIKNTTTFFKERKKGRIRIPRYIGEDKVLLPYNKEKSEGKYVLYHVDDEAHSNEHYLWHIVGKIKGTNHLLLCSNKYCLFISSEDFKTSRWKFRLSSLHRADVVQGNLVIYLSRASTPISNFLGAAANLGGSPDQRVIPFEASHSEAAMRRLNDTKHKLFGQAEHQKDKRTMEIAWK